MQNRRHFIKSFSAGAFFAAGSPVLSGCKPQNTSTNKKLTDKVKTAMLSMQWASWEHGVAAQALLESGDHERTYLFAKVAVLRQTDEGRLSVHRRWYDRPGSIRRSRAENGPKEQRQQNAGCPQKNAALPNA